ncbi:MAG: hypothetical protein JWM87_3722 [Candidatus Eremiobacteraeota bacterium]|nr:hypothetical protein [Candidatus Eremiobacteraeota bacterium]
MHLGWYLAAPIGEFRTGLNALQIEGRRLVVLRRENGVEVYDADCPHRGANLANGVLRGKAIVCAFHARTIALGERAQGLCVRQYRTLVAGDLLFVRDPAGIDGGFEAQMSALSESHTFLPIPARTMTAPARLVIENAFDSSHFQPVHHLVNAVRFSEFKRDAGYAAGGTFVVPASPWQRGARDTALPFVATAYSPSIVISELGGARPYTTITAARDTPDGALVRIVLALAKETAGDRDVPYLLRQLDTAIDADEEIWREVREIEHPAYFADDAAVLGFRTFADEFRPTPP